MNRLFSLIVGTIALVTASLCGIVNVFKGKGYGSSKKSKRD